MYIHSRKEEIHDVSHTFHTLAVLFLCAFPFPWIFIRACPLRLKSGTLRIKFYNFWQIDLEFNAFAQQNHRLSSIKAAPRYEENWKAQEFNAKSSTLLA